MALMVSEEKLRKLFQKAYNEGWEARDDHVSFLSDWKHIDLFIEECKISLDKS